MSEKFYCTTCGTTAAEEQECCGSTMLDNTVAEGFGLSDFEPKGSDGYEMADDWN